MLVGDGRRKWGKAGRGKGKRERPRVSDRVSSLVQRVLYTTLQQIKSLFSPHSSASADRD